MILSMINIFKPLNFPFSPHVLDTSSFPQNPQSCLVKKLKKTHKNLIVESIKAHVTFDSTLLCIFYKEYWKFSIFPLFCLWNRIIIPWKKKHSRYVCCEILTGVSIAEHFCVKFPSFFPYEFHESAEKC